MIKKLTGLAMFSGILGVNCDPARRIDMKNNTSDTAEIIWTLNEDSLLNNPFLISNSTELKFRLFPPKTNRINMSFGRGNWTPDEITKLVGYLESLEINSASQHIKIDAKPVLKEFLLARRRGVGRARIEIVVSH
jgi:hypothetical protein